MQQAATLELTKLLWFLGWLVAVAALFVLALRLPLQTRLSRLAAWVYTSGVIAAIVAGAVLANMALALHDLHLDLTRQKVFTPSERALEVVYRLDRPVSLTYFYRGDDPNGQRAKDVVEVMGRRNPLLKVHTADPDKHPALAKNLGAPPYNAAILEADGRRILVHTTDETEIAIGIQRVLREQVINVCFMEGHNEYPVDNFEFHTHLEGMPGHNHDDSASAVVKTTGHGVGRMRRSLESLGYDVRAITPAREGTIPPDCAVTIDAGPRTTYLPAESAALEAYLRRGGSLLLMYDLGYILEPGLERLLNTLGVRVPQAAVLDPKSHYATDAGMVAVTAYERHPITRNVSFTFYPGARPVALVSPADGIRVVPLIKTSGESYAQPVAPVEQRQVEPTADASAPAIDATPQPHVLAVAIEGLLPEADSRPFRALVIGDGDFASNSFFPYMANSDLALAMVRWLLREERAAAIASRVPVPPLILLTADQMRGIFLVVEVLLPLTVIVLGGVVWWSRR